MLLNNIVIDFFLTIKENSEKVFVNIKLILTQHPNAAKKGSCRKSNKEYISFKFSTCNHFESCLSSYGLCGYNGRL